MRTSPYDDNLVRPSDLHSYSGNSCPTPSSPAESMDALEGFTGPYPLPDQPLNCEYCGAGLADVPDDPPDYTDFGGWLHLNCVDPAIDEHNAAVAVLLRGAPALGGGNSSPHAEYRFREVLVAPSLMAAKLALAPQEELEEGPRWNGYRKGKRAPKKQHRRSA